MYKEITISVCVYIYIYIYIYMCSGGLAHRLRLLLLEAVGQGA